MSAPQINPGEISNWPLLKIRYRTDAEKIAALLPPGIDPGEEPNVSLNIYNVPVPDEPEMGVLIAVDADYRGTKGFYTIGLGIDQEAAIAISRDMNGQPKYPSEITYYRMGDKITARCTHQGYTYVEFEGTVTGVAADFPQYEENEWWVKVSRAVGGAEKAYDFPPHVVHVKSTYSTTYRRNWRRPPGWAATSLSRANSIPKRSGPLSTRSAARAGPVRAVARSASGRPPATREDFDCDHDESWRRRPRLLHVDLVNAD